MFPQTLPLGEKGELHALHPLELGAVLLASALQSLGIAVAQLRLPTPPGGAAVDEAQHFKQSVVIQPALGAVQKGRIGTGVQVGPLVRINEGGVAGEIRAHPVR